MNLGETIRVGSPTGIKHNPYLTNNQALGENSSRKPDYMSDLPKQRPQADAFIIQNNLFAKKYHQNILTDIQNRLLTRFLPESLVLKYADKEFLENAVKANPKIIQMLAAHNIHPKIEPQNVISITKSHLLPTMFYTKKIMNNSGLHFTPYDYEIAAQAALLHDLGKALIPSEILNKNDVLNEKEREIVDLHSKLGYEILKTTPLNSKVLEMIKNHHNSAENNQKNSLTQILTVADIYSALKEPRPYKKALSNEEAFEILTEGSENGAYNKRFVNALKKSQNYPVSAKTRSKNSTEQLNKLVYQIA